MATEQSLRKTVVLGARTGQRLPKGEVGIIVHYDLTDEAAVSVIRTDDIGYETDAGYEVIGKTADDITGLGLTGNPHPTRADRMMPHGAPCSTVADGMIVHGAPCSTVADRMMLKQGSPR